MSESGPRKIIHVDMDAFFASVEQRDRPELRGRPVVVGGTPEGRGVVASASYEARRFGVKSAMSAKRALALCPSLQFVRPDFEKYERVSQQIRAIFLSVTDRVEPLSLDEAYLDVTVNRLGMPLARDLALWVKERIRAETGLTASAGVGPNKFIAKVASDYRKPDGLVVVPPERVEAFISTLPVERLWGVGPVTAKKLQELGFHRVTDLRQASVEVLETHLGKFGRFLHGLAWGQDDREVEGASEPKSRGTERTFSRDLLDVAALLSTQGEQCQELADRLREHEALARTVTVKVRYADFRTITRSRTLDPPTDQSSRLAGVARALLLEATEAGRTPIRLLGLSVSGWVGPDDPLQLWFEWDQTSV